MMFRKFVLWLEKWIFEDNSILIGFTKVIFVMLVAFIFVMLVALSLVFVPIDYVLSRQEKSEMVKCLEHGNGWAIVGVNTTYIKGIKHNYPVYGCLEVIRPVEVK
jgi:hypothetical protein